MTVTLWCSAAFVHGDSIPPCFRACDVHEPFSPSVENAAIVSAILGQRESPPPPPWRVQCTGCHWAGKFLMYFLINFGCFHFLFILPLLSLIVYLHSSLQSCRPYTGMWVSSLVCKAVVQHTGIAPRNSFCGYPVCSYELSLCMYF